MRIPIKGAGRRSLLFELWLLVAAALLPLLGLLAWNAHGRLQHDLDEAMAVAGRLARFTATDTERFLRIAESLLAAAARHPAVAGPGRRDCDQAFSAFAALKPAYGGYVVTDPQGRVACSGDMPGIQRLPGGAHAQMPPQAARSRFWVGQIQPDADGGWVVPMIQPARAAADAPQGFAGVRFRTAQFRILVSARLPEDAFAGIMDGAGQLLAHTRDSPALGADFGLGAAMAAMGSRDEGMLRAAGDDGDTHLYGFARVAGTDWVAFAVLPAAPVYAAALAQARNNALASLAVLALGLVLATLVGRRLLRPALGAARAAHRAAGGNLAVRLPEEGPAELAFVAMQFNRMLDALAAERLALAENEKRLHSLFRLSADWYWEQDAEHRFTKVEGGAFDAAPIYKNVIGKRRWEMPDYAPLEGSWDDFRARLERREAFYDLLFRQTTPAGETHFLRASGVPGFDPAGAFAGYHGVASDVTQEMSQRLTLEERERKYRDLFDKNHLINLLVDPASGRIADASEEACAFFDHSRALLAHMDFTELGLRPHGSRQPALDFLGEETAAPKVLDCHSGDGRPRVLEAYPGQVEVGGRRFLFVTLHDITVRRRAEDELRKLVRAVEQSPASILITDTAGNIEYVNPRFEAVTGYAREEAIGQNPRIMQSGLTPKVVYEDLWRTVTAGGEWRGELCNKSKQGELYWEYASISAILDEGGRVLHYLAVKENITERKRREAEILALNETLDQRVAERTAELERANRELDAFSYSVSHDLRAPLRAINGFVHLAEESEGTTLSAEGREMLGRVKRNALRMGELIDDMLKFARIGRGALSLEKVSPGETAAEVVQELQGLYPQAEAVIGSLPGAVCDRALLKQVFANLIGNAFKYSARQAEPKIEIGARQEAGETVYFVRDNGAGFDMQYAQRLFGVFQRLHHENEFPGTGVGLAIVKRIVERHGGRVWAESAPGAGATFHFTLGAAAA